MSLSILSKASELKRSVDIDDLRYVLILQTPEKDRSPVAEETYSNFQDLQSLWESLFLIRQNQNISNSIHIIFI